MLVRPRVPINVHLRALGIVPTLCVHQRSGSHFRVPCASHGLVYAAGGADRIALGPSRSLGTAVVLGHYGHRLAFVEPPDWAVGW